MTLVTLVVGGNAAAREKAIAAELIGDIHGASTAVILEGAALATAQFNTTHRIARIAAGCPCCTGKLAMRVTLNRMLRTGPARLYIGLADDAHLDQFRLLLMQPPYAARLVLTADIRLSDYSATTV